MKVGLVALLLAGIYYSTLVWLEDKDWGRADYSYGYIIPLVSLYLIWEKRRELQALPSSPSWVGYIALVSGLGLFWLGELSGEFFTLYISFWLVIVGLCWVYFGWRKLKVIGFALAILLAMFPPPHFISDGITLRLKLISSQLGVSMLQAYGMSAFREGNVIDLGFTQLQVVDACSGLRYLFPLLIMGLLLAYFYKAALWKKVLLVLSAIPLTIFTNSLRIAATGILYEIWGPAVAEDFFHGFSGWLIFIFGLGVLLVEMWVLSGFRSLRSLGAFGALRDKKEGLATDPHGHTQTFSSADMAEEKLSAASRQAVGSASSAALLESAEAAAKEGAPQGLQAAPPAQRSPTGIAALLHPPQFLVAVVLLAATLAAAQGIEFREKIPPAQSFAAFPMQVGDWTGKRDVMEEKFIKELDLSDYVIVDYVNGGQGVNLYTAYYESQRKGESIHSPETCLPGSGWEFRNAGSVSLPLADRRGGPMRVNKALMIKGNTKQLSYFWFPQRDRVLTNAWELKLYNFWDALTRQRTDGALVRLITPVYPNENAAQAEQRLTAFTQAIVPVLNEYLPK
jgi:EpsI family protein